MFLPIPRYILMTLVLFCSGIIWCWLLSSHILQRLCVVALPVSTTRVKIYFWFLNNLVNKCDFCWLKPKTSFCIESARTVARIKFHHLSQLMWLDFPLGRTNNNVRVWVAVWRMGSNKNICRITHLPRTMYYDYDKHWTIIFFSRIRS